MKNPFFLVLFLGLSSLLYFGCSDDDEDPVPGLIAIAGPDVTITRGQSITLGGEPVALGGDGTYSYSWDNDAGTTANPTVSPSTTTTYTLTVTDGRGSEDTDEIVVTVTQLAVNEATIDDTGYTAGGTLQLLYSIDNGATFETEKPTGIALGTTMLVKVNNGNEDLAIDKFIFDWSGSSIAPADVNTASASFTVTGSININVTLKDRLALVAANRRTGIFYKLDKSTGTRQELFAPRYEGDTLKGIRAFVYHYGIQQFYASEITDFGGRLFRVDRASKEAIIINENNGNNSAYDIWDAIVSIAIAEDDSLLVIGDFNNDGNGMVKFGTDGGRSLSTLEMEICCGLGMIYDPTENANTIRVGNGWDSNDGEIVIDVFDLNTGGRLTSFITSRFNNFPVDISGNTLNHREMVKDNDGTIYAIIYDRNLDSSYLVQIDTSTYQANYISSLGTDNSNQYLALTLIPEYLL